MDEVHNWSSQRKIIRKIIKNKTETTTQDEILHNKRVYTIIYGTSQTHWQYPEQWALGTHKGKHWDAGWPVRLGLNIAEWQNLVLRAYAYLRVTGDLSWTLLLVDRVHRLIAMAMLSTLFHSMEEWLSLKVSVVSSWITVRSTNWFLKEKTETPFHDGCT